MPWAVRRNVERRCGGSILMIGISADPGDQNILSGSVRAPGQMRLPAAAPAAEDCAPIAKRGVAPIVGRQSRLQVGNERHR